MLKERYLKTEGTCTQNNFIYIVCLLLVRDEKKRAAAADHPHHHHVHHIAHKYIISTYTIVYLQSTSVQSEEEDGPSEYDDGIFFLLLFLSFTKEEKLL